MKERAVAVLNMVNPRNALMMAGAFGSGMILYLTFYHFGPEDHGMAFIRTIPTWILGIVRGIGAKVGPTAVLLVPIAVFMLYSLLLTGLVMIGKPFRSPSLRWVRFSAVISPELGLLGTFLGVLGAMGNLDSSNFSHYTATMGQAFVSTVVGLSIAMVGKFILFVMERRQP